MMMMAVMLMMMIGVVVLAIPHFDTRTFIFVSRLRL
jgi:hypothetical protein